MSCYNKRGERIHNPRAYFKAVREDKYGYRSKNNSYSDGYVDGYTRGYSDACDDHGW